MEENIKKITEFHHKEFIPMDDPTTIEKIYNLLNYGIQFKPESYSEFHYTDMYKESISYTLTISKFIREIEKGNVEAIIELVDYYKNNHNASKKALIHKYYKMASDRESIHAMIKLAQSHESNAEYSETKKYYLKAIELGNCKAMILLANYYKYAEKNYEKMKEYCMMAVEQGNIDAIIFMAEYYKIIKNYNLMKKYYEMAIEKEHIPTMVDLGIYYYNTKEYDLMKKYYMMAVMRNNSTALANMLNYYSLNKMYVEYLELYIAYHKINDSVVVKNINFLIKNKLYVDNEAKFTQVLINYGIYKNNNLFKNIGLFICLIVNSMIEK